MKTLLDLTGQRFGELVALERDTTKPFSAWKCRCDCGAIGTYRANFLRGGRTRSCGCLRVRLARTKFTTHGYSRTRTYKIWLGMVDRCRNQTLPGYRDYGGRGITFDPAWEKFENFLADMGEAPANKSLDRKDNDGNYEPSNCKWSTPKEQSRNTRRNCNVEFKGKTQCLQAWCEELGLVYSRVQQRLNKLGWPVGKAFSQP